MWFWQSFIDISFLTTRQSQNDKRYQIISVTEAGFTLSKSINANGERTAAILVNGMNEEEQRDFIRLLCIALENVKNDGRDKNYKHRLRF